MPDEQRVEFTEDRIPAAGIGEAVDDLVELYGGEMTSRGESERRFVLPLRVKMAVSGGVECTVSWAVDGNGEAAVKLTSDREIDAPRFQRIALLVVGVIGALAFTMWPFFGKHIGTQLGALAWIGGAVAFAVYFMTLRRTPTGMLYDFLQRLASRQRESITAGQ